MQLKSGIGTSKVLGLRMIDLSRGGINTCGTLGYPKSAVLVNGLTIAILECHLEALSSYFGKR